IYTTSGAFIMSGMTNTPLDISSLPSGMYIVRMNDDEMIRFIKQ
ncbi:MAG: T9SS C-terminal target domain-containing protein, partial [Bacteroidetes bacterium]|nr:T9SS C-terminal target domain-containing protein [Bacteroidota bacterium]